MGCDEARISSRLNGFEMARISFADYFHERAKASVDIIEEFNLDAN